jgi:vacuolar-type H+-ATPase subunit I/STV1
MQNAMSTMLADVKAQKLNKMKSIKKLSNEKTILNLKFRTDRETNSALKIILDENMKKYRNFQIEYDVSDDMSSEEEKEKKKSELEGEMIELLSVIERDRGVFIKGRDVLKVSNIYSKCDKIFLMKCDYEQNTL